MAQFLRPFPVVRVIGAVRRAGHQDQGDRADGARRLAGEDRLPRRRMPACTGEARGGGRAHAAHPPVRARACCAPARSCRSRSPSRGRSASTCACGSAGAGPRAASTAAWRPGRSGRARAAPDPRPREPIASVRADHERSSDDLLPARAARRREPRRRAGRAMQRYLRGQRIDVQAIAAELGLGRTTIYRWFGSREGLIGEVLNAAADPLLDAARAQAARARRAQAARRRSIASTAASPMLPRCASSSSRSVTRRCGSSPRAPASCSRTSLPGSPR